LVCEIIIGLSDTATASLVTPKAAVREVDHDPGPVHLPHDPLARSGVRPGVRGGSVWGSPIWLGW
jgi:hypothetical protein